MVQTSKIKYLSENTGYVFGGGWYDLAGADNFWMQWRLRAFQAQLKSIAIPATEDWKVLDLGCGHGVLRSQVEQVTAWRVDAADINEQALKKCDPGRGDTFLYDIREQRAELAGHYDAVIAFDVLEHLVETRPFLESLLFHLKAGGYLFVNVPAMPRFFSAYDDAVGHQRRYDRTALVEEIAGHPLELIDARYWGFSMLPLLMMRRLVVGRKLEDLKQRERVTKKGFRPPGRIVESILKAVMQAETRLFSATPIGTSFLCACKKC